MNDAQGTAKDISMKGAGYYSKATTGAKDVIDNATPMVLGAIRDMDFSDDGRIITMSDMGCADGGTSLEMVRKALVAMRAKWPSCPIQMIYTDLPRNDFSQVFQIVHGLTDIETYLGEIDQLYVFASATSFHKNIFPAGTLHLGFSATASHYISEIPVNITDHVHMVGASGGERQAFEEQGRKDWESFLLNRTNELASGGHLALFNFGIDEEGRYLGHSGGVSMFETFSEIWAEFRDSGTITAEEYTNTNFPQCYRTVDQFTAPLKDENNPVYQAGLRLKHVETRVVRCPYERDFTDSHGDAARFAREYIPTLRSWSEMTFASGLSADRPVEQRIAILDDYFSAYEARVREAPLGHAMDYVHIYLVLQKI